MHAHEFASLEAIGLDGPRAAEFAALDDDLLAGRVVRIDRGWATVTTAGGDHRARLALGADVAVGDWVALNVQGVLVHVLERRGAVTRLVGHRHDELQVVAANVDVVFVVRPLDMSESLTRIRSLLALSYDAGAIPVVLLTKADLVEDPGAFVRAIATLAPGVEVVVASVVTGEGTERIAELVKGRTVVLLGESGAGKSTLTNLLVGAEVLEVGEVRADGQGRHTTSHRELLALPGGGAIIDTPGIRDVVGIATASAVDAAFEDVGELAARCRFADCAHRGEPGCAIAAALADGSLTAERLDAYEAALRDVERMERRGDKAAEAERRRANRAMARQRRSEIW